MATLAPHETLELHELLSTNSTEIKTISSTLDNLRDEDLKTYLQNYLNFKRDNLQAIQKLIDTITTEG